MFKFFKDLLFPSHCAVCGREGQQVCKECFEQTFQGEHQHCPGCRKSNKDGKFCDDSCRGNHHFNQLVVAGTYIRGGPLKKIIVRFKYKLVKELSLRLGALMGERLKEIGTNGERKTCIVAVPSQKKKMRARGFNPPGELAKVISKKLRLPYFEALIRTGSHFSQAKLSRKDRLKNLQGQIRAGPAANIVRGMQIILVDDVATTGTTLDECSKTLRQLGAKYICCAVIARGR